MLRNTRFLSTCLFVIAFTSTSFLLAGCGGGSTSSGSTPEAPTITLSATSLTFPSTTVGQTSTAQTVTVSNTGGGSATISGITLSGNTADFAQTNTTCGAALASGLSCAINFTFTPQTSGNFSLTITVADNASNSPQTLTLTGTGVGTPQATLSTTGTLSFASTIAGSVSATQTVTLSNGGNGTLNIAGIALGGTGLADFTQSNNCGLTLVANTSCTITVAFAPIAASTTYNASVTVTDNAGNITGATQSFSLTGTSAGVPAATLSTAALTFPGTTNAGSTASAQTVTLTNGGTAALAISSIVLAGANPTDFATTNNCGTSVAAGGYCTLSVTFSPAAASTTYNGVITITDNAGNIAGTQQLFTIVGTSTSSSAPTAILSANVITFTTTTAGTTTAAQTVTVTNSGTTALGITSIVLGGTNTIDFATTNNCGSSVAANGGTCTISATFSPAAGVTASYTATITLTDNANNTSGSQQTITLNGSGTTGSVSRTFYVFGPSAPAGVTGYVLATPLYTFINSAKTSIDMTMYELQDTIFSGDLVTACGKGIKVRVILSSSEKSSNTPAYNQLNTAGANCSAVLSNTAFENTHQKTITIDGSQTAILSLNLQTQYYSTSRDFALIENDAADIAAIEATFNTDWAAGTPYNGTQGASDFSYVPGDGDTTVVSVPSTGDLIWSPINAQTEMLRIINGAKSTLYIENEEMSASNIVSALETACTNGVKVYIAMVNSSTSSPYSSYSTEFKALEAAGCGVRTYPDTSTGLYIHAKAVVADYGLSTQAVYMGSINYSTASMTENRELGIYIADSGIIQTLYTVLSSDYAGATTF